MVGTWTPIGWAWVPVMERGGGGITAEVTSIHMLLIYIFLQSFPMHWDHLKPLLKIIAEAD